MGYSCTDIENFCKREKIKFVVKEHGAFFLLEGRISVCTSTGTWVDLATNSEGLGYRTLKLYFRELRASGQNFGHIACRPFYSERVIQREEVLKFLEEIVSPNFRDGKITYEQVQSKTGWNKRKVMFTMNKALAWGYLQIVSTGIFEKGEMPWTMVRITQPDLRKNKPVPASQKCLSA